MRAADHVGEEGGVAAFTSGTGDAGVVVAAHARNGISEGRRCGRGKRECGEGKQCSRLGHDRFYG